MILPVSSEKKGPHILPWVPSSVLNTKNKISEKNPNIILEVLLFLSPMRCNSHYSENLADRSLMQIASFLHPKSPDCTDPSVSAIFPVGMVVSDAFAELRVGNSGNGGNHPMSPSRPLHHGDPSQPRSLLPADCGHSHF